MSSSNQPLVCLEISPECVAGVEIGGGTVNRWFTRELQPGTIAGGAPTDPVRLATQIRAALNAAGIRSRRARLAVSDMALVTRVVAMPRMPKRDLKRAVKYAAERDIPIPAGQSVWSWTAIPANGHGPKVRLIAGWRDVIEQLKEAAVSAGLEPEAIEPRSAALARCLRVDRALVLEVGAGQIVQGTAIAPHEAPFSMHAIAPLDPSAWPLVLEPIVFSARRQLGGAGRELPVLVTEGFENRLPEAIGARSVMSVLAAGRLRLPPNFPAQNYLAPLGLALAGGGDGRLLRATRRGRPRVRRQVQQLRRSWVAALIGVSAIAWTAAFVSLAVLLGWHPPSPFGP